MFGSIGFYMASLQRNNARSEVQHARAPPARAAVTEPATAEEDEVESSDDDVFEAATAGNQRGTKRTVVEAQPLNVLALRAVWVDEDGVAAHTRAVNTFVQTTNKLYHATFGTTFTVAVSKLSPNKLNNGKGQLQINCFYEGKKAVKNLCCQFGLSLYAKRGSATVTRLVLEHRPDCKVFEAGGRKKNAKTSFLGLGSNKSWSGSLLTTGTSGLQTGAGKVLQFGVMQSDGIRLTRDTADRTIRKMKEVTLPQFLWHMAQVAPYLLACKAIDPEGLYLVGTECGTYELDGVDEETMREFKWLLCIPSYAKRFWQGSDARMMSIDMAHRHAFFGGAQFSAVTRDGYGGNHHIAFGICAVENKESWVRVTDVLAEVFPNAKLYMSDKDKGLQSTRLHANQLANEREVERGGGDAKAVDEGEKEGSDGAQEGLWLTIFGLCCIHGLANCGTTSAPARELVTKWARAGTHKQQAYYLEKIRDLCGDKVADEVHARWRDMSFLGYMECGLETNYGLTSSNPVEQNFSKSRVMRGLDPYLATRLFMEESFEALTALKLRVARDMQASGGHAEVVPEVIAALYKRTQEKKGKWIVKIIGVDGEHQEAITFKVSNTHDSYKVVLRAGDALVGALEPFELPVSGTLRWHQRCACQCLYTRVFGWPCDHGAQCLLFIGHHAAVFNQAHKSVGGRLLEVRPELWYPKLGKWWAPEYHLRRMALSLGNLTAVVPTDVGHAQLYPWNITQSANRRVKRYRGGRREGEPRGTGDVGGVWGLDDLLAAPEGWGPDENEEVKVNEEGKDANIRQKKVVT